MTDLGKKHKISFIIPVLNGEKLIAMCLDNIIKEMAPDDEIIVVDNGSTDTTIAIARGYPGVRVLEYPKVTISALRNRGSEVAKGELFAFIDCDCMVCEGWRAAAERVMKDESIHATGSVYDIPEKSTWVERAWLSERFMPNKKINYLGSGNMVVRREVFNDVNGFDETLKTDEDSDIGARINKRGYTMYHESAVRVIHLGNAKTLADHFRRKLWHSTSMLDTAFKNGIDKPFIMTIVFIMGCLAFLILFPISLYLGINILYSIFILMFVSILTALHRIFKFKNYKYFFQLIVLFFVFYLARSVSLFKSLLNKLM
jgi:glycosyltransferase involved in cell wall biosynthesis